MVVLSTRSADHVFDNHAAMVVELIAPITLGAWLEGNQVVDASMGQPALAIG